MATDRALAGSGLHSCGGARYSPANIRSTSMVGILAIIIFIAALALMNRFEFGRFD